jgi:chromosome segregation ATPase
MDMARVDEVTDNRAEMLKTVKFGGYDKASVDYYIDELNSKHNKEVDELKENVNKLSEAVLSLKTMREVNMTESTKTIDSLKKENEEYESELESLKEQINAYKQREMDNAGRYESISRTLLEARESADALIAQTEKECTDKKNTITAELEAYETEVRERCAKLQTDTEIQCQQMYDQTEDKCKNMKDEAYSEAERTRNKSHADAEALSAKTEYECKVMREEAQQDATNTRNQATDDATRLRNNVKRECDSVSKYMSDLLSSLDNVVAACASTKSVADKAFTGLKSEATAMVTDAEDAQ